ncbi:MAG TPA: hypothetical protein VK009_23245 [Chloroflexota bacterium]|nr:hypothetical protein [Chloroflexota bacterium]
MIQREQRLKELARQPADAGALVQPGGEVDADANGARRPRRTYFRLETK